MGKYDRKDAIHTRTKYGTTTLVARYAFCQGFRIAFSFCSWNNDEHLLMNEQHKSRRYPYCDELETPGWSC